MAATDREHTRATASQLAALEPLGSLSPERIEELAQTARLTRVERGTDPVTGVPATHSAYLLQGELLLAFRGGGTLVVVGGTEEARAALNRSDRPLARAKAITDVTLVLVDNEMLDIASTWDEVAAAQGRKGAAEAGGRAISSAFSLVNLKTGLFAALPAAHIDDLFRRFERLRVKRGEVIIREGDEAGHYFVIEAGRCGVERMVGGTRVTLAELRAGGAFGEEALVSGAKRNATVTALSDADLLRLDRADFDSLLREPLLRRISFREGSRRVQNGAVWLDVRYPSEYQNDKLPGAINVPLSEVRNMFSVLDPAREYIVYCQSGRRSAAAAFLFAQRGFDVWVLDPEGRPAPALRAG
jgi:rhodanese-related sulfurtransferase